MCQKCYGRGKIYSIDGSITLIKACNCEVAKEKQANFTQRMDKLRKQLNDKLSEFEGDHL